MGILRRVTVLRAAGVAGLAALLLGAPAARADRASALAQYRAVVADEAVGAGWTGSVGGCVAGTESAASLAATLRTVNALRALAGVGPVTFDPARNADALAAALMMRAANRLSHTPGTDWPCHTPAGAAAAGSSNLYLGRSGAAAMVGYVDDGGVPSLGHRRWLLDPAATQFGSGSTGTTNALWVFGPDAPVAAGTVVAWPPSGWTPWPWVFEDWSVAVGGSGQAVSLAGVAVTVSADGAPLAVDGVSELGQGFGTGRTLRWRVTVPAGLRAGDHRLDVTIAGVTVDGQAFPVRYAVEAFRPDPPVSTPRPAVPALRAPLRVRRADGRRGPIRPGVRLRVVLRAANASSVRLRWLRDGRPLRGATAPTRLVRAADRGHRLSVRVVLTAPGGARLTATSPSVAVARG